MRVNKSSIAASVLGFALASGMLHVGRAVGVLVGGPMCAINPAGACNFGICPAGQNCAKVPDPDKPGMGKCDCVNAIA